MHRTHQRLPLGASLLGIGAGVVWSVGAVMSRKASGADAFQYLIWRSVGIILVVEVMSAIRGNPFPTIRAWRSGRTMALANVGIFLASICFVYAVKTTTPANAAFLSSLTPLIAVVFARFLGERLSISTICALAVGLLGLLITVFGDLEAGNMAGNLAAIASSVGFVIYSNCVRTDPDRDWSPCLPGYGLLMIVVCTVITLFHGKPVAPPTADITYAMIHGGVVIVVGTLMFNAAAKHVPSVPMTVFAQTEMVFVPVWGWLVLGLAPRPVTLVGGALIFAAVIGKAVYDTSAGRTTDVAATPEVPLL